MSAPPPSPPLHRSWLRVSRWLDNINSCGKCVHGGHVRWRGQCVVFLVHVFAWVRLRWRSDDSRRHNLRRGQVLCRRHQPLPQLRRRIPVVCARWVLGCGLFSSYRQIPQLEVAAVKSDVAASLCKPALTTLTLRPQRRFAAPLSLEYCTPNVSRTSSGSGLFGLRSGGRAEGGCSFWPPH